MQQNKLYAEINGMMWQVGYPMCGGCPELIVTGECAWEGNGCRFPDRRMEMPISYYWMVVKVAKIQHKGFETLARELGNCIPESLLSNNT